MKVKAVIITQPIDLGEYNEAMSGGVIHVWVNPPRSVRKEREELLRTYAKFFRSVAVPEKPIAKKHALAVLLDLFRGKKTRTLTQLQEAERKVYAWFAELWSQGDNPELHWSVDEVAEINEQDPVLYQWLIRRSVLMVDAWQGDKKK